MKNYLSLSLLIILSILFACSDDENQEKNVTDIEAIPQIELSEHLKMDSGAVRMFTMPTPLQVATSLKLMNSEYHIELLLPHNNNSFKSDIDMALGLGAYVVDMGYTTVYNNYQESINYGQDIQALMEKLNISHYVNQSFVDRFKNNVDHQDSLCHIILSTYHQAHSYFNDDEGLGLLILTGAYVEGLYLATQNLSSSKWQQEQETIYIQQKLFLDNFILLLSGYQQNSNVKAVVNQLKAIEKAFLQVVVFSDPDKDGDYVLEKPMTKESKNNIKKVVSKVRNQLLKGQ